MKSYCYWYSPADLMIAEAINNAHKDLPCITMLKTIAASTMLITEYRFNELRIEYAMRIIFN